MEKKERKSILHEFEKRFMFIWYKNEYVKKFWLTILYIAKPIGVTQI